MGKDDVIMRKKKRKKTLKKKFKTWLLKREIKKAGEFNGKY